MALDGLVVSNIVHELNQHLIGGRIDKITQPEKDEIIIAIRNNKTNYKLLLTVEASMPRIHFTKLAKKNPLTPPNFCMFLRKHITSGKILSVKQPDFERIIEIELLHRDELGDLSSQFLIIEIMGRHSNIILLNQNRMILDSIKHVNASMSSVREVLPGRQYMLPPNKGKISPLEIHTIEDFKTLIKPSQTIHDSISKGINGISYPISEEICYRGQLNSSTYGQELSNSELENLYLAFKETILNTLDDHYAANTLFNENGSAKDFSSVEMKSLSIFKSLSYSSISELLEDYYKTKSNNSRVQQKTSDIRKLVQTNVDRCKKKYSLQKKQIEDTGDKDKFKIKGELINGNLYHIQEGMSEVTVFNYYTNKDMKIKLDPTKSPAKNAQSYYDKYNKKKRTFEALTVLIKETKSELEHLESIQYSLENANSEEEIEDIRTELMTSGYIRFRKKNKGKKQLGKSSVYHYISSDGFHMYVGKNNLQNEELSFKFANGNDWWFHAKEIPGSHVIVKTEGQELTDRTYEEAASLAAYHSKGRNDTKVLVDYTLKKNLKKPNGSAPGYTIYHTNYSLVATPSIHDLEIIEGD